MPKPIILLENHAQSGARRFVADHIVSLKRLGYTKLLFEMNSEISPASFKKQCSDALLIPGLSKTSRIYLSSKALMDMITALEENHIPYEFIDPETQAEAIRINGLLRAARTEATREQVRIERRLATQRRDLTMAQIIKREVALNEGGVIFLGGFQHVTLLQELKRIDPDGMYRPTIFTDTRENVPILAPGMRDGELDRWISIHDKPTRDRFYNADVHFFDMAKATSFDDLERRVELSDYKPCREIPTVGQYFNTTMQLPFTYTVDEAYVLSASIEVVTSADEEATRTKISKTFPGLSFFSSQVGGKTALNIPGLNMLENRAVLEETFKRHGIMTGR